MRYILLILYIVYFEDKPVAVSAIFNNNGVASLYFVATLPEDCRRSRGRYTSIVVAARMEYQHIRHNGYCPFIVTIFLIKYI